MRFEGIDIVSLPTTEVWFGWGILTLVVLFGLLSTSAPGFISEKFKLMFVSQDRRTYSSMTSQINSSTFLWSTLFTLLSLTMSLFICIPSDGHFGLERFGIFGACLIGMFVARILVMWALSQIFGNHNTFQMLLSQYSRILFTTAICSCALLFVYLLLPANGHDHSWVMIPSMVFYALIMLWHFYRIMPIRINTGIYLALYVVTVEVLPMLILVNNYNTI